MTSFLNIMHPGRFNPYAKLKLKMSLYHQEKEKKVEVEEEAKVEDMLKWKL